jgi:hypothetical protein
MRKMWMLQLGSALFALACSSPSAPSTTPTTSTTTTTTPTGTGTNASGVYARFQSAVTVSIDTTTVTLRSNGTPDHPSPYWGSGSAMYEAAQAGMQINPNLIAAQSFVLRVPLSPASYHVEPLWLTSNHGAASLIGVLLDGFRSTVRASRMARCRPASTVATATPIPPQMSPPASTTTT